jgi:hypothetical protein
MRFAIRVIKTQEILPLRFDSRSAAQNEIMRWDAGCDADADDYEVVVVD